MPALGRERQNSVERAMILCGEGPLTFELPTTRGRENTDPQETPKAKAQLLTRDELKRQEREAIVNALQRTNGKVWGANGAAVLLGMKPRLWHLVSPPWASIAGPSAEASRSPGT
jgi:transcriptional regulator with GAF, ATPase, and Fis domain